MAINKFNDLFKKDFKNVENFKIQILKVVFRKNCDEFLYNVYMMLQHHI